MDQPDDRMKNLLGRPRIAARQIDELIGLARGITADEAVTAAEVEMLKSWLTVNDDITREPVMRDLARRIEQILGDGVADAEECGELLQTLKGLCGDSSPGELLKSTSLPLCSPAPSILFEDRVFCFTGTFNFGTRKICEAAVLDKGGRAGALTMKTDYLIVGVYATESWKHSAYGNKIIKAAQWRDGGAPISLVGENHWRSFL